MKAAVYGRFGPPEVVEIRDVAKPVPKDDEVLIAVRAASVNPLDLHFMRGEPYMIRLQAGLRQPRHTRLGVDVAGRVEAAGGKVTGLKAGDDVFGACRGAFAEYACASESALAAKPGNVTFEQAAAAPIAALTALQCLRDHGQIQPGRKVLINGAAGGVGTFAVEIAKSFGAEVTGVCSWRHVDMVRSIGADHVIDYLQENFTQSAQRYDLMLDCIANHSLLACRRVLNPQGRYVAIGGRSDPWMAALVARAVAAPLLSRFVSQKLAMVMAKSSRADLAIIQELLKSGKVTPVIDRRYKLCEVTEAMAYLEQGHAGGKVIITI